MVGVRLDPPAVKPVSLQWTALDGTATAGQDYVTISGSGSYTGAELAWQISLRPDSVVEAPETFHLDLSAVSGATTTRTRITVTILDNDAPALNMTVPSVTVEEGNSGSQQVEIHLRLAAASDGITEMTVETVAGTATPGDFQPVTKSLSFAPGEVEKIVPITVYGDTTDEGDETFELVARQGSVVRARGTVTILDEDTTSFSSVADATIEEKTGSSAFAVVLVTLAPTPIAEARLDYATSDVSALAGSDYVAASGTVVFSPGQATAEVRVEILGDGLIEPAETFSLRLSNAVGAYLHGDRATVTIFDDDSPAPPVAIANASILEGNGGSVQVPLKVILAHALTHAVNLTVATNGAGTATSADYQALTQSVTFAPGQAELTVLATVHGDTSAEADETFGVEVREGTDVRASATVTIIDDDTPSLISVADGTVQEKTGSSVSAVFRVTISPPPTTLATVEFTTANGTALAGSDYTAFSGTILFSPGQTHTDLAVEVLGDSIDEPNETFTLRLSGAVGATIQDDRATATIVDDDASSPISVFTVADTTVAEKTGSSAFALFRVMLSPRQPRLPASPTRRRTARPARERTTSQRAARWSSAPARRSGR